jgi:hypothetical protein
VTLIFVDCEADYNSPCPGLGEGMTEFGAVEYALRQTFHGLPRMDFDREFPAADPWYATMIEFESWLHQFREPYIFVSDNPAYDWQWINYHFHHALKRNPFGHSARRIGDYYAGLVGDFRAASKWKKLRITKHDHNPVNDAMGNVEAFERILKGER